MEVAGARAPPRVERATENDSSHIPNADEGLEQDNDNEGTPRGRTHLNGNVKAYLAVQGLTPSPTPSPRSTSPSLLVTEIPDDFLGLLSSIPQGKRFSTSSGSGVSSSMDTSPSLSSKTLAPHELQDIPELEEREMPRQLSIVNVNGDPILKLSASEMEELTSSPESLPATSPAMLCLSPAAPIISRRSSELSPIFMGQPSDQRSRRPSASDSLIPASEGLAAPMDRRNRAESTTQPVTRRPVNSSRAISSPITTTYNQNSIYKTPSGPSSPRRRPVAPISRPEPLDLGHVSSKQNQGKPAGPNPPSPIPQSIPLPPMSIPTYLQLELSSSRPSPLYIYRTQGSDIPYESSRVKFERLLNFLYLPPQLERVLYFGTLACLDAWLYTFTILPLRFFKAIWILIQWWYQLLATEARFIIGFIYHGIGRMWHRSRGRRESLDSVAGSQPVSRAGRPSASTMHSYQSQSGRPFDGMTPNSIVQNGNIEHLKAEIERKTKSRWGRRHRRTKSQPSSLSSYHKADLLQGAVIICSCMILMQLDASRMYHSIRGQAAIKLYVIFNVLEVFDKLLSALGQDILECLFSNETLERDTDGRSKILRPLGMFILALIYNVVHAAALFYQVITLNVAVNSYSNALLTLLMSNQFVEIKSTVFKKIEKDNLFQLTCADIVERFQLWLMLMIIALRNIVEVGGLSMLGGGEDGDLLRDATAPKSGSILPNSFTVLPSWSGEVLSPFLIVLGSEMVVDWIKHTYIAKFNNVKPAVYTRYLDVLAKDYYTNAFVNQNLIKRLGLPVLPLSCLFIRSAFQTYHMFLATHTSPSIPFPTTSTSPETTTALSLETTSAAFEHFDTIIRRALQFSPFTTTFGMGDGGWGEKWLPSTDSVLAVMTMVVFFLGCFLVLLVIKLVLGMLLLRFAREKYREMKKREFATSQLTSNSHSHPDKSSHTNGKVQVDGKDASGTKDESLNAEGSRLGIWGMTEVSDDSKRWIYDDDRETLRVNKEKEAKWKEKSERMGINEFGKISRYEMVKRIW